MEHILTLYLISLKTLMLHDSNLLGVANRVGFQKDFTTEIAEKKL